MCGRFTLFAPSDALAAQFGLDPGAEPPTAPRYNIAPGGPVLAIRQPSRDGKREAVFLRWGLVPSWAKDPAIGHRLVNARAETAGEKPAFRGAFRYRRCLLPADGFYEWTGGRGKRPFHFRMRDGRSFAIAGLWDRWEAPDGSFAETCTILTTAANVLVAPVHDRMPVILPPDAYGRWLDPDARDVPASLLVPFPDDAMTAWPVSPLVNDPRADAPQCIDPAA